MKLVLGKIRRLIAQPIPFHTAINRPVRISLAALSNRRYGPHYYYYYHTSPWKDPSGRSVSSADGRHRYRRDCGVSSVRRQDQNQPDREHDPRGGEWS